MNVEIAFVPNYPHRRSHLLGYVSLARGGPATAFPSTPEALEPAVFTARPGIAGSVALRRRYHRDINVTTWSLAMPNCGVFSWGIEVARVTLMPSRRSILLALLSLGASCTSSPSSTARSGADGGDAANGG